MGRYLLRRVSLLIPVLFGISLVVFVVMALIPGDPALAILGPYASADRLAELRRELGLGHSLPVRYLTWLGHVIGGDLGRSTSLHRPVLEVVVERTGPTLLLSATALVIGSVLGLLAGAVSAAHRRRADGRALSLVAMLGISLPAFWLAMLLMLLLAVWLPLFPVSGMTSPGSTVIALDTARHLLLPATTLGLVAAGVIARMTHTAMLDALGQDYVRMARAKGLGESDVRYRHAFRTALSRSVPIIGLQAGFVLGGAVYVETVFQWPGLGSLLVHAVLTRDVPLVQGGVLVLAFAYVMVNLATDVIQRWLDPRVET
jgi:peptide/nickel transport system permease protein